MEVRMKYGVRRCIFWLGGEERHLQPGALTVTRLNGMFAYEEGTLLVKQQSRSMLGGEDGNCFIHDTSASDQHIR